MNSRLVLGVHGCRAGCFVYFKLKGMLAAIRLTAWRWPGVARSMGTVAWVPGEPDLIAGEGGQGPSSR